MNKIKRRYNWKARQVVQTDIDNTSTKKIRLDKSLYEEEQHDDCNVLALPSEKRKTKRKKDKQPVPTKLLSKKQRKHLEKIVEKKKKKENRSSLLAALAEVQVSPEFTSQLTSIATVQTRGLKRHKTHTQLEELVQAQSSAQEVGNEQQMPKISSIAGSKKLRKKLMPQPEVEKITDLNIVGFENHSSSSSSEDSDEEAIEEISNNLNPSDLDQSDTDTELPEIVSESSKQVLLKDDVETETKRAEEEVKQDNEDTKSEEKITELKICKPAVFVHVHRPRAIQAARLKLPVLAEEQAIMEAINENPVIVLAGETGSGKTTQVPQFLYEAGYASNGKLIGVTEPRRVAAVSMSRRVAEEMGLTKAEVSYLIRFEGCASDKTRILFMTDGVLLREARHDLLLSKYSVIIVDEAHERSVFTDILIGLLSRIVSLRARRGDPLKLIIMSATLRLADFTENTRLFRTPPPVVSVDSRQFPVTVHFARRTATDYVGEAYRKASKIHSQLPDGGILIFLTGQQEVKTLVRRLRRAFPYNGQTPQEQEVEVEEDYENFDGVKLRGKKRKNKNKAAPKLPDLNLDSYPIHTLDHDDDAEPMDSDLSSDEEQEPVGLSGIKQPMWVLPLYSLLPSNAQARVFAPHPSDTRLCVVSTNVAETSLTIPGIKYVIDCGRSKTRQYDKLTGVSAFNVDWTSKASADQRAGRAGRVAPGHCYRLYSSAVFNDQLPLFAEPEIRRRPVDDLVIQMKAMGIHKVVNFPFPSAPDLLQLRAAERRLTLLGALEQPEQTPGQEVEKFTGKLTALGRAISGFPVAPRYGKMLALSAQHEGLLPHAVLLVAALSVQELLLDPTRAAKESGLTGQALQLGDPAVLLRTLCAAERAAANGEEALQVFCEAKALRHKGIVEVRKLRAQLTSEINLGHPDLNLCIDPKLPPPSETQARLLRQVVLAGMVDQVATRVAPEEISDLTERAKWKHAYRCGELEEPVFMQSSCVLRRSKPQWVVYQEVFETSKLYMRGVTVIEPEWLPLYGPLLCNLSAPLPDPPPRIHPDSQRLMCSVTGTFGRAGWELPRTEIDFPKGVERYKLIAKLLLEGQLFPKLLPFRSALLSTPETMNKNWSNLVPRTAVLLNALAAEEADSKQRLQELWKENPHYLLSAYQQWLPESAHNKVFTMWPPT